MQADLHVHSVYSDGIYSPDEACRLAKKRGVSLVSITDHDTLAGLENKREAAKRHGLFYLSGWEVSAYAGTQKVHVLGYGCKVEGAYEEFTEERKIASFARAKAGMRNFLHCSSVLSAICSLSQPAKIRRALSVLSLKSREFICSIVL